MALRFLEGFEGINHNNKYISSLSGPIAATFPGRISGKAESLIRGTFKTPSLGTEQAVWFIGFGVYAESGQTATNSSVYFTLFNGATAKATVEVRWNGSRFILLVLGGGVDGNVLYTLNVDGSSTFMAADQWNFFEFRINLAGGLDSFQIRKDGEGAAFASASLNYGPSPNSADAFAWHTETGWHLDDMRALDSSGAENNSWLGPLQIVGFQPDGNGNSNDWDKVGAALTKALTLTDGNDTTYLSADTTNETQLMTCSDVSTLIGTIYGIQLENTLRTSGIGTRDVRIIGREDGTDYNWGDIFTISDTQPITFFELFETSPDAGAWSPTVLNAMQYGLRLVD